MISRAATSCMAILLAGFVQVTIAQSAQTEPVNLKVYVGGQQRPDIMRELFAQYSTMHPGVNISLEIGGATSELNQKYLNMVLTARDSTLDIFLIDIIRPAQFAAARWAEPLDPYFGNDAEAELSRYLPAYREANTVNGKMMALPALADSLFLYYRKDLLAKYHEKPPTTWPELARIARKIQQGENNPNLQGLSFQGKAVEGAVCTFLLPYWSLGGEIIRDGKTSFERGKAEAGLEMWRTMVSEGIAKKNIAEVGTDDTRKEFQAGKVVFGVIWGYAWNHFQGGADTQVKDKVGVVKLPAMPGGKPVSCMGGWNWAVSAYSKHKPEAVSLIRWLSSPYVSKQLALRGSFHPVFPAVYQDPEVLTAVPWFADALPVVETARPRPVTPVYKAISDALRINTNTVMAGVKTPKQALDEIEQRVARALR
ncbi:MAG: ABC transporter substrate-binding protein [Betaproteobacteria bacterium]